MFKVGDKVVIIDRYRTLKLNNIYTIDEIFVHLECITLLEDQYHMYSTHKFKSLKEQRIQKINKLKYV